MNIKKLQWTESSIFFAGWTIVMLLGADFPPPVGFVWVVLGIALIDALQWVYLGWLLKALMHKRTFWLNLALFMVIGFLTAMLLAILNGALASGTIIWLAVITIVAMIYGIIFWIVNWLIAKKMGS